MSNNGGGDNGKNEEWQKHVETKCCHINYVYAQSEMKLNVTFYGFPL